MELPKNVCWFERLSYGSLAVTALLLPFNERAHPFIQRLGAGAYLVWLCIFVLLIFVIRGISRQRMSWLRWVRLVFVLFGLFGVAEVARKFTSEPIYFANWLISMILDSASCYLIFTGDAIAWFKPQTIEEINAPIS